MGLSSFTAPPSKLSGHADRDERPELFGAFTFHPIVHRVDVPGGESFIERLRDWWHF
ncbi:hypothetical protein [Rhodococcus sp. ARC_M6]|uniref:hypothetical protein n=1 Tax=Rhodococcus sp. ARC_M6 TaxID=2928852 RepID=UPI001FB4CC45|nr:hypothetical protein [Rhodococcus sp. ARC_M6]MCJ0906245.1 hypothetical protein [Rhodococcus sp. ARC_M6]